MAEPYSFDEDVEYEACRPGIISAKTYVGNGIYLTDIFNFRTQQVTHVCESNNQLSMTTQNFKSVERQEAIEEMRLKLIELGGDPNRFATNGLQKRPLMPPKTGNSHTA